MSTDSTVDPPGSELSVSGLSAALRWRIEQLLPVMTMSDIDSYGIETQNLLRLMKNHWNSKQKINTMPPEILSRIFTFAQTRVDEFFPPLDLDEILNTTLNACVLPLTQVCIHWRIVASATTGLWSQIFLSLSLQEEDYQEYLLDKLCSSGPTHVYLDLTGQSSAHLIDSKVPGSIIRQLMDNHGHRLQTMNIGAELRQRLAICELFSDFEGPDIQSFSLDLAPPSFTPRHVDITLPVIFSRDTLPSLERLSLKEVHPLMHSCHRFKRLTHLCIEVTRSNIKNISLATFCQNVLKPCRKRLRYLELVVRYWEEPRPDLHGQNDPQQAPIEPISISGLEMVILTEGINGSPWAGRFLSHIRIPPSCILHLAPQLDRALSMYPAFDCDDVGKPRKAVFRPMSPCGLELECATFHNGTVHIDSPNSLDVAITRARNYLGSVHTLFISASFFSKSLQSQVIDAWTSIELHAPILKDVVFRDCSTGITSDGGTDKDSGFDWTPILQRLSKANKGGSTHSGGRLPRVHVPTLNESGARLPRAAAKLVREFGCEGDNIIGGVTFTVGADLFMAPSNPYAAMALERRLSVPSEDSQ